ncbi:MAG: GNAT family protein [Prolixibacteraceae bacterium]|jgi:ribosomal-protein-serine acetyltransferase|nr:GNAT family protein [Prolixibacteraceae bacterium]
MELQIIIVDKSIVLKPMEHDDAQTIFDAIDGNRVFLRRWLPFVDATKTVQDSRAFVKSIVDDAEWRQEVFTIWHNREFAGLIGLKDVDYLNCKLEIGYWLIEKMTGKGIMTQSAEQLISFCFSNMEVNRICIKCAVNNTASSNIPKRLGFTFEGVERNGERYGSRYLDLEVYSILRKEWVE